MIPRCVEQLIFTFQRWPHEFFHERELHACFFGFAREQFGLVNTAFDSEEPFELLEEKTDSILWDCYQEVHRLRYEYNSLWRYSEKDGYQNRYTDTGTTLEIDFVVLRKDFVSNHKYLDVVNKDESRRTMIRQSAENADVSPIIELAFEFKMAHLRSGGVVGTADINALQSGMLKDCRKLAHERVGTAFILGFSHGPLPSKDDAKKILSACTEEFTRHAFPGNVRVILVTPSDLYQTRSPIKLPSLPPAGNGESSQPEVDPPPTSGPHRSCD